MWDTIALTSLCYEAEGDLGIIVMAKGSKCNSRPTVGINSVLHPSAILGQYSLSSV